MRYNIKHRTNTETDYNFSGLKDQLIPMCYTLRCNSKIQGGEGRISNTDESLTYRWIQTKKLGEFN